MGLRVFQSMRLRLAVYHVLAFAVVQAIFGVAFLSIRRSQVSRQLDDCLRGQAKAMANTIELAENYDVTWPQDVSVSRFARGFSCAEFYYHIRKPDGTVIDSSDNLADRVITKTTPPIKELKRQGQVFQTISGPSAENILGEGGRFRLLSVWHETAIGRPLVIQVAMSLSSLDRLNEQIFATFLAISTMALLASGIAMWLIANRAMRPWREIRTEVSKITPDDLGQRIDVSEVDAELSEVAETLNKVFDRVDRAFKAQNEFLTNAAHELRTPVAVLLGEAQIMLRKPRTLDEYAEYIESIEEEMRRLSRIVEGMLTLARTRAGTRILALDALSANDLIIEAMEDCQAFASQRSVQFSASLALYRDDEVEPNVRGDRRLLVAMFDNILRNSIRVSPVDGRIDVSVKVMDAHVEFTVMDRGPGIPEEMLQEIFVDFKSVRVRGSTGGGAGIGLTIARNVAELHDGEITASNRPDGGAQFTVRLPLDKGDDAAAAETRSNDDEAKASDTSGA